MDDITSPTVEDAKADAVTKASDAQLAVENARKAELAQAVSETASQTKAALLEGLKEVFGDTSDSDNPGQMKILVRRIPIICTEITQIHEDISKINNNIGWGVKIVIGAVILGILKLVVLP